MHTDAYAHSCIRTHMYKNAHINVNIRHALNVQTHAHTLTNFSVIILLYTVTITNITLCYICYILLYNKYYNMLNNSCKVYIRGDL